MTQKLKMLGLSTISNVIQISARLKNETAHLHVKIESPYCY